MPAFPADAKGLLINALRHNGPVLILEYRTLYDTEGPVSEELISIAFGWANIVRAGKDLTIVSTSYMSREALIAAEELSKHGISVEVLDLRSIRPIDEEAILSSIKKTGHLLTVDTSWELYGVTSEVAAIAADKGFNFLKGPVRRLALANCPAPVSQPLEKVFYPSAKTIVQAVLFMLKKEDLEISFFQAEDLFRGPY